MTLQACLAPDLYSWSGGFFGDCCVVEPGVLREKMVELHRAAIAAGESVAD